MLLPVNGKLINNNVDIKEVNLKERDEGNRHVWEMKSRTGKTKQEIKVTSQKWINIEIVVLKNYLMNFGLWIESEEKTCNLY